jgi:hypothetical protein
MKRTDDQSLLCWHGGRGLDRQSLWRPVGAEARVGQGQGGGESATGRQPPGRRRVVPRWRVKEGKLEGRAALGSRAVSCHGDGQRATWLWLRRAADAWPSSQREKPPSDADTRRAKVPRAMGDGCIGWGFWLERSLRHDPGFPHVDPPAWST